MAPAHPPGHDVSSYSSDNKTQFVAPAFPPAAAYHPHHAWHLHAHVAMAAPHTHPSSKHHIGTRTPARGALSPRPSSTVTPWPSASTPTWAPRAPPATGHNPSHPISPGAVTALCQICQQPESQDTQPVGAPRHDLSCSHTPLNIFWPREELAR